MNNLIYGTDIKKIFDLKDKLKDQGLLYFKGDINNLYNEYFSTNLFDTKPGLIVDSDLVSISDISSLISKKGCLDIHYFVTEGSVKPTFAKLFDKVVNYKLEDDKTIFAFTDSLFSFRFKKTLELLPKFEKDEDKIFLVYMIYFNLKNLMYYYFDKKSFYKLNPYVAKKTESLVPKISKQSLIKLIHIISEADYKMKSFADKDSVMLSTILVFQTLE